LLPQTAGKEPRQQQEIEIGLTMQEQDAEYRAFGEVRQNNVTPSGRRVRASPIPNK
jgi:hypothetical protein